MQVMIPEAKIWTAGGDRNRSTKIIKVIENVDSISLEGLQSSDRIGNNLCFFPFPIKLSPIRIGIFCSANFCKAPMYTAIDLDHECLKYDF